MYTQALSMDGIRMLQGFRGSFALLRMTGGGGISCSSSSWAQRRIHVFGRPSETENRNFSVINSLDRTDPAEKVLLVILETVRNRSNPT